MRQKDEDRMKALVCETQRDANGTYLQNRIRVTDAENRLMLPGGWGKIIGILGLTCTYTVCEVDN